MSFTQAFDGDAATKWLTFSKEAGRAAQLEYWLQPGDKPAAVLRYALTFARDACEHDPRNWTLEGLPADADDAGELQDEMHILEARCSGTTVHIPGLTGVVTEPPSINA